MSIEDRPTVICVTPVKNEASILDRFLRCTSQWADHIIIADQQSDDSSRRIARSFGKVKLIDNDTDQYDEAARQKLLLEAARSIPVLGRRLIIALDADEILTANWSTSPEWKTVMQAAPGTVIHMLSTNVTPIFDRCWVPHGGEKPVGFMDDGSPHRGRFLHSPRIPLPPGAPSLRLRDIRFLHYKFADWEQAKCREYWYQCWELLKWPDPSPLYMFRRYANTGDIVESRAQDLRPEWIEGYAREGIDMTSVRRDADRWTRKILDLFDEHGTDTFAKLDIWHYSWEARAKRRGRTNPERYKDPRGPATRLVHRWLRHTQPRRAALTTRTGQKVLRALNW